MDWLGRDWEARCTYVLCTCLQDFDEDLHGDLEEARVLCGGDGHVQVVREVLRGLQLRLVLHGDVGEGLKLRRPVYFGSLVYVTYNNTTITNKVEKVKKIMQVGCMNMIETDF